MIRHKSIKSKNIMNIIDSRQGSTVGLYTLFGKMYDVSKILAEKQIQFQTVFLYENESLAQYSIRKTSLEQFAEEKKTIMFIGKFEYFRDRRILNEYGFFVNKNLFIEDSYVGISFFVVDFLKKLRTALTEMPNKVKTGMNIYIQLMISSVYACWGVVIKKRIEADYKNVTDIYIYDYSGMGDVYVFCLYLKRLQDSSAEENKEICLVVKGNTLRRVARMCGIRNVVVLTNRQMKMLVYYARLPHRKDLHIITPFPSRVKTDIYSKYLYGKRIDMASAYRCVMFGLTDNSVEYPQIQVDSDKINSFFEEAGIQKQNTVILSPFANTVVGYPESFWINLSEKLKNAGFVVGTNVTPSETEIPGTKRFSFSLEDAQTVLDYAGFFVGVRSGFCDIICNSSAYKCVLYPSYKIFNSSVYDFCSFEKMGIGRNFEEIRWNYEKYEDLADYVFGSIKLKHELGADLQGVSDNPKVSVIMPSLNVAPFISKAMDSVVGQSLRNIEILCIDAGSTDGTLEILQNYAKKDDRVRIIQSDKKSYGYQLNLGIDEAKGDYIGIVETDDYIETKMYEVLYASALKTTAQVVKSDFDMFSNLEDGIRVVAKYSLGKNNRMVYNKLYSKEDYISGRISVECYIWDGIYNKRFLKENNIRFNETPGAAFQDFGFKYQVALLAERIIAIPETLYHYRRDNTGASTYSPRTVEYNYNESVFLINRFKLAGMSDDLLWTRIYTEIVQYAFWPYISLIRSVSPAAETADFFEKYKELFDEASNKKYITRGNLAADLFTSISILKQGVTQYMEYARAIAETENSRLSVEVKYLKEQDTLIMANTSDESKAVATLLKICGLRNICAFVGDNNGDEILTEVDAHEKYPEAMYIVVYPNENRAVVDRLLAKGVKWENIYYWHFQSDPIFCTSVYLQANRN